jgi:hypothetical protein
MRYQQLGTVVIAALTLAGCGTAATNSSTSNPSTSPASAAPASPASQAGPGGLPVTQTVREGQPFTVTYQFSTGGSATWKISLDSARCGTGAIFDPGIMAAYAASIGDTLAVPQPHAGMQFCLVKFSGVNESTSQQNWQASLEATLNVGMNAYTDTAEQDPTDHVTGTGWDAQNAYQDYAQPQGEDSDFGINPGVSAVSWAVFEVPQAAKVTSVSAQASAYTTGPQVVITLP